MYVRAWYLWTTSLPVPRALLTSTDDATESPHFLSLSEAHGGPHSDGYMITPHWTLHIRFNYSLYGFSGHQDTCTQ